MSFAPFPETIDRYVIRREIGSGGQSRVFEADDPQHHRVVALKLFDIEDGDDIAVRAIAREIEALGKFDEHPHVVTLHDSGVHQGRPYLVMTYYSAGSLMSEIRSIGPLPVERVLACAQQIGSALMALHARGIIHRDIKPHNVFIGEHGFVLGDLGIAIDISGDRSVTGGIDMLTPPYAAPEVLEGRSSTRETDMYSLGATLYHALAGRRPFDANSIGEQQRQIMCDPPPPIGRPDAPAVLVELVERLLAKQPGERWSAESFVKRLPSAHPPPVAAAPVASDTAVGVVDGGDTRLRAPSATAAPTVAPPVGAPAPTPVVERTQISDRTSSRTTLLISGAIAVVLALAVGLGVTLLPDEADERTDVFQTPEVADEPMGDIATPQALSITEIDGTIRLTWAAVDGVDSYRVVVVGAAGRSFLADVDEPILELPTTDVDGSCFEVRANRGGLLSQEPAEACLGTTG